MVWIVAPTVLNLTIIGSIQTQYLSQKLMYRDIVAKWDGNTLYVLGVEGGEGGGFNAMIWRRR